MQGLLLNAATGESSPTQWGALAIGLLTLIYIAFIRPLRNRNRKDPLANTESKSVLAQQRSLERDMAALLVDYEQMIRQMTAQVETRVAKLEILLREADGKLEQMRAESGRLAAARSAAVSEPIAGRAVVEAKSATGVAGAVEPTGAADTPAQARAEPSRSEAPMPVTPTPTPDPRETAKVVQDETDVVSPLTREIYQLADAGLDAAAIARRTGSLEGEVALILAIRQDESVADSTGEEWPDASATTEEERSAPVASASRQPAMASAAGGEQRPNDRHGKRRKHRR